MDSFEESCKDIRSSETDFANYLCEDVKKFKLEEVFNIFKQFCDNINTAKKVRLMYVLLSIEYDFLFKAQLGMQC